MENISNENYPTLKELRSKWKCSNLDSGIAITAYKGNETHEIIPSELADGTKIVAILDKNGTSFSLSIKSITHLKIEALLTSINDEVFRGCSNLQEVVLPNSIESVGAFAFAGCYNLENLELPQKITSISENAFESCTSLTEITIPKSVELIGVNAFSSCTSLKKVNVLSNETIIKNAVFKSCNSLVNEDDFVIVGDTIFDYIGNSKKVIVPDGVIKISGKAFCDQKFKEVVIPDSVEYIGVYAFGNCKNLTTLTMGDGVKIIADYGFQECPNLKPFEVPKNLKELGFASFAGSRKLNDEQGFQIIAGTLLKYSGEEVEIVIPEGVVTIVRYAFSDRNIKKVTLPSTLEVIKEGAFYSCKRLAEIIFSDNLKEMEDRVFFKCSKLKDIKFPDGVKLGKELFEREKTNKT